MAKTIIWMFLLGFIGLAIGGKDKSIGPTSGLLGGAIIGIVIGLILMKVAKPVKEDD